MRPHSHWPALENRVVSSAPCPLLFCLHLPLFIFLYCAFTKCVLLNAPPSNTPLLLQFGLILLPSTPPPSLFLHSLIHSLHSSSLFTSSYSSSTILLSSPFIHPLFSFILSYPSFLSFHSFAPFIPSYFMLLSCVPSRSYPVLFILLYLPSS